MTALVWDQVGSRRYETGCDRGVLYPADGPPVPWNGLTSVDEDASDVLAEDCYLDGHKYLVRRTPGDYSGTLKALTYPDEFLPYDGISLINSGAYATNQPVNKIFGLSYRTRVGTDSNPDAGYKIHILYNLTAVPDSRSFTTLGGKNSAEEFSWKLHAVPPIIIGKRPTAHVYIDSTKNPQNVMDLIEGILYGTSTTTGSIKTFTFLG